MGIQNTRSIAPSMAIARIKTIAHLIKNKRYQYLDKMCATESTAVDAFIDSPEAQVQARRCCDADLFEWSHTMIEGVLDSPFYRESIFDNYELEPDLEAVLDKWDETS
jgi:hypothetical protein